MKDVNNRMLLEGALLKIPVNKLHMETFLLVVAQSTEKKRNLTNFMDI